MKLAPTSAVRVVLVDDSVLVRMGLRTLFSTEKRLTVVGEAQSVSSAAQVVGAERPDVVLLDIRLPDGTGFDACRQILGTLPSTRILFLTSTVDDQLVEEAIRAGGHGYLLKEINGPGLIQAILDVAAGQSILDPAVTARVMKLAKGSKGNANDQALALLSPQEKRVLALIAQGKTNKEVGVDLSLSEKTVKNYLSNIFEKLHITRRSQAATLYTLAQSKTQ